MGFPIPPTLAGMALIFAFGLPFLLRLGRLAKQHNSATIADLVVARLRADRGLGFTITLVALFGIIPYIALQLKPSARGWAPCWVMGSRLPVRSWTCRSGSR